MVIIRVIIKMVNDMNDFKKKVKEKIKEYSNDDYLAKYIKNEYSLNDGCADIMLKIDNKNDLFDSRTYGNQLNLNESIYSFIDNKASMLDYDISISLNIICSDLDSFEKERIKHVINEHYAIELYKAQKEYKRNKIKTFKLALVGILFLLLYAFLSFKYASSFFIEVFGFLFSFSLWQVFESLIYTLSDIKIQSESITHKLIMDIKFKNNNEK